MKMITDKRLTFTGVDQNTNLDELPLGVEIGVLFTWHTEGRPRYPSRSACSRILARLSSTHATALHVCGVKARKALLNYALPDLTHNVSRIQVNGFIFEEEIDGLCSLYSDHEIITQYQGGLLQEGLEAISSNHSLLVDSSGGTGVLPEEWVRPNTRKTVGFAGGIGPDNIVEVLEDLKEVASGDWWIDMESSLRDERDWFNCDAAKSVLNAIDFNEPGASSE